MNTNNFQIPLQRSMAIVAVFILLLLCVPSHQSAEHLQAVAAMSPGLMFLKTLYFPFALVIAIFVSIAILFGIFLLAVALDSPSQATALFNTLVTNISALITETTQTCKDLLSSKKCCSGCCSKS